ncbi:hypothetical protein NUU61_000260 [Penicillium alfredii]|uniref:Myb-like domain-containing protein n=1 Tax=Penicillium alfredii TaxID=1506179 RepID=A0A9W9G9G5_9EURO|nr:uncharacterized protein NUU61_000260 [Penicillium alfredii]KAJ5114501.1 hypothetical protein NUU61_000260 [Penicillium alfredii]
MGHHLLSRENLCCIPEQAQPLYPPAVYPQSTLSSMTESEAKASDSSNGGTYRDPGCGARQQIDEPFTTSTANNYTALVHPMPKPTLCMAASNLFFLSGTEETPSLASSFEFTEVPQSEPAIPNGVPFYIPPVAAYDTEKPASLQPSNLQITSSASLPDTKYIGDSNAGWLAWPVPHDPEPWYTHHPADIMAEGLDWANGGYYPDPWPISDMTNTTNTELVQSPGMQAYNPSHALPFHVPSSADPHSSVRSSSSPIFSESDPDYPGPGTTDPFAAGHRQDMHAYADYTKPTYAGATGPDGTSMPAPLDDKGTNSTTQTQFPEQPCTDKPSIKASMHYSDTRNAFLIDCKRRGLSYKDIKRIGGFKEAESTLRGRFRTLTKSKEQRVRKPKWQEKDIILLRQAVAACASPSDGDMSQPPKVSWKKVAQHIWTHGGSYYFGNATCKKKWCEIYGIRI